MYSNCSRVSTPLCYNYLQLVNIQDSAYSSVMGSVDIVPVFGKTFNIIFPMLLLLLIFFNAFDIYAKVFKAVGIERFQFDEENPNQLTVGEGRRRLSRERGKMEESRRGGQVEQMEGRKYKQEVGHSCIKAIGADRRGTPQRQDLDRHPPPDQTVLQQLRQRRPGAADPEPLMP